MPRFAANLSMLFNDAPFLERFARAAAAGLRGVEFLFPYDYPAERIAEQLDKHGLTQVLFNLPPGDFAAGERGLAALPDRAAEFREGVDRAIDYARALGCTRLHAMAGLVADEAMRPRMRAQYLENLRYAARRLQEHGLTLLIEPINSRSIPGYFINRQAEGHAILAELGEPNLKVQMDFFHAQIMEGDLATTYRRFQAGVGHVQIAGVPDRHEPDTGEVNYPYLYQLLDDSGYDGWIGCEYSPRGLTEEGLGWYSRWR
ncbi:2-oxo-tetronate isomerase [Azotobacter beijerinckii]|uniref:2-oxo-tetronate isomerase n=1 Tax=Azotobacter beijerinckii TaxID=170623 RepID=UPI002954941E|nr:2-oxo-tetronate isomerase [Azotobacter beijerinckii]MDV7212233.1 2-oxo-tetronate isomerase [Azotobacter beijerinckii]